MKAKGPSEHQIQSAWFQWWDATYRSPLAWATPNGGFRAARTAAMLKKEGVRSGVPDVFIAIPKNGWAGMFIEFKKDKGRLTDNQKMYLETLSQQGYYTIVAYGLDEGIAMTELYLKGEQPRGIK